MEETKICKNCHTTNPTNANFCRQCGQTISTSRNGTETDQIQVLLEENRRLKREKEDIEQENKRDLKEKDLRIVSLNKTIYKYQLTESELRASLKRVSEEKEALRNLYEIAQYNYLRLESKNKKSKMSVHVLYILCIFACIIIMWYHVYTHFCL